MTPIIAPIKPGDTGAPVANLQDTLAFLATPERKIIQAIDAPDHPTPQELKILTADLRPFRVQQNLGDGLHVEVEEKHLDVHCPVQH
jgi:hypothetical protein